MTLAANKGHLSGVGVALDAVNQLTLSGADATSQMTLGVLGSSTQEYGITVDASGLKGGLALGNTDAGTGDVALNLAGMTGAAAVGTVEGNNVTIHAAQLRGYESPLDKALKDARMQRATLDARFW